LPFCPGCRPVTLQPRHAAYLVCGERRQPPDMEDSCECIEQLKRRGSTAEESGEKLTKT